jgi:cell division protein FtsW (lipid II flippase)
MRPAVVLLGFVLGSATAITFALAGTMIVFVILRSEYPRLDSELRPLLTSLVLFALLTIAAGSSFYGVLKGRRWRHIALAALAAALVAVAAYHAWPVIAS